MGDHKNKKSKGVKRKGKRPWRERQAIILANARQQRRPNDNDSVRANNSNNSDDNASDIDLNYTHSDSDSVRAANNTNNSDSVRAANNTNNSDSDSVRANNTNNSDRANNTNNSDSAKIWKRTNSEILISGISYIIGNNCLDIGDRVRRPNVLYLPDPDPLPQDSADPLQDTLPQSDITEHDKLLMQINTHSENIPGELYYFKL